MATAAAAADNGDENAWFGGVQHFHSLSHTHTALLYGFFVFRNLFECLKYSSQNIRYSVRYLGNTIAIWLFIMTIVMPFIRGIWCTAERLIVNPPFKMFRIFFFLLLFSFCAWHHNHRTASG